jgi:putative transposase
MGGPFQILRGERSKLFLDLPVIYQLNLVRANMVSTPGDYWRSNYHANRLGKAMKIWTPHCVYRQLGKGIIEHTQAYREMFRRHLDEKLIHEIRQATHQGMALASDRFKEEIQWLSGRRVMSLKRGPKPKQEQKCTEEFLLRPNYV